MNLFFSLSETEQEIAMFAKSNEPVTSLSFLKFIVMVFVLKKESEKMLKLLYLSIWIELIVEIRRSNNIHTCHRIHHMKITPYLTSTHRPIQTRSAKGGVQKITNKVLL